jgi:endoglucanase Acf2
MANKLRDRFVSTYGSIICGDIHNKIFKRKFNLWDKEEKQLFELAGAHDDKCTSVVGNASSWAMSIILDELENRKLTIEDIDYPEYIEP